jgi:hypothetical protein
MRERERWVPKADTSILTRFSRGPEDSKTRTRSIVFPPAVNFPTQYLFFVAVSGFSKEPFKSAVLGM